MNAPERATRQASTGGHHPGPAIVAGGWALQQFWLFWVAPIIGAALAGLVYPLVAGDD